MELIKKISIIVLILLMLFGFIIGGLFAFGYFAIYLYSLIAGMILISILSDSKNQSVQKTSNFIIMIVGYCIAGIVILGYCLLTITLILAPFLDIDMSIGSTKTIFISSSLVKLILLVLDVALLFYLLRSKGQHLLNFFKKLKRSS